MTVSEMIDRVAQAVHEHFAKGGGCPPDFGGLDEHHKFNARQIARAALAGIDAAGFAIVPKEATDAECIAGLEAGLAWMKENGVDALSPFADYPSPAETTRRCYRAMVAAGAVKP